MTKRCTTRFVNIEGGDFLLQQEAVAILAGVTVQTINNWHKQPSPPPRNPDGSYSAREFSAWLVARKQEKMPGFDSNPGRNGAIESKDEAEVRLTIAKADRAEMDNEVSRGNLIAAIDVETAWQRIIVRVKTALLGMPAKHAAELARKTVAHECRSVLDAGVRDILVELSNDWRDEVVEDDPED